MNRTNKHPDRTFGAEEGKHGSKGAHVALSGCLSGTYQGAEAIFSEQEGRFICATACLEGRASQDRRSPGIDRLPKPIYKVFL